MTGTVPVYILTGFLDSGKTTFLNGVLRDRPVQKRLILQFEEGEVELEPSGSSKQVIWTLEAGATQDAAVRHEVAEEIANGGYEEIWIEWNGMAEFSDLEALLLEKPAGPLVHIEKVFYIADVAQANLLLGQTGEGPVSQLAGSDVAFWHHASDERAREAFLRKKNSVLLPFGQFTSCRACGDEAACVAVRNLSLRRGREMGAQCAPLRKKKFSAVPIFRSGFRSPVGVRLTSKGKRESQEGSTHFIRARRGK